MTAFFPGWTVTSCRRLESSLIELERVEPRRDAEEAKGPMGVRRRLSRGVRSDECRRRSGDRLSL